MPRPRAHFDFTILDETDTYLVVSKPAPLQIHPSKPKDFGLTLWDGLRELLSYELVNGGQISIVNRLDRETSGVVLIAKDSASARRFGKAMMRRQMQKSYLAVVLGWPEWEHVEVQAPMLRAGEVQESRVWLRQMVHEQGVPCHSTFRVLHRSHLPTGQPISLIQALPHTGRTHQLRVHLSHLGYPILGDKLYGLDDSCYLDFMHTGWTPELASKLWLPRQALHSHQLKLEDEHGAFHWIAPLPDDLASLFPDVDWHALLIPPLTIASTAEPPTLETR